VPPMMDRSIELAIVVTAVVNAALMIWLVFAF
jgi:hypothetical protein